MNPERLWAKSWDTEIQSIPPRSAHFVEHLKDVLASVDRVLTATAGDQLMALGLPVEQYHRRFVRIVRLAAAIHDLGKANDHFQLMVRGERDPREQPQGLRHEWVTILLMEHLRELLLPAVDGSALDLSIAEWAVAGHHPSPNHLSPPRGCPPGAGVEIKIELSHQDFTEATDWLRTALVVDLGAAPQFDQPLRHPLTGVDNAYVLLKVWENAAQRAWQGLDRSLDRRLVPAVKNCLIAADIAGSALPRQAADDGTLWDWIDASFDSRPQAGDLDVIASHRLGTNTARKFQTAVADSTSSVTYVKAGCGSGKTLAAYLWAAANHPQRRLYFCYPTTGTATEGFKDYLFPPESEFMDEEEVSDSANRVRELGAKLFHSRRDVDFEIILTAGNDTPRPEREAAIRIDALESWSTPIVACTVDTVLGIVQNNRRGLLGWPALAQAAFVFDEIHAFDDLLFGALLRFLRDLPGLPVLLMTASLPQAREEALRRVLEKFRPEAFRQQLVAISGPPELEERPRYHRATLADNDPLPIVAETVRAGGKVLRVCNTVQRVMDAADRAAAAGLSPIIYHSRFRYEDRAARHKAVIDAFRSTGPALAICSQVAEMSLDLSADLLVTDLAPVPALIQRLGRLNRRAAKGDPTKPFVIVEPDGHLPYTPDDQNVAKTWIEGLPAETISQRQLAEHWEESVDQPPALIESAWLDGGPTTMVSELRDLSPGISVILNQDDYRDFDALLRYENRIRLLRKQARKDGRELTENETKPLEDEELLTAVVIPMPPPPKDIQWREWQDHYKRIPVADPNAIEYHANRGAQWRRS